MGDLELEFLDDTLESWTSLGHTWRVEKKVFGSEKIARKKVFGSETFARITSIEEGLDRRSDSWF